MCMLLELLRSTAIHVITPTRSNTRSGSVLFSSDEDTKVRSDEGIEVHLVPAKDVLPDERYIVGPAKYLSRSAAYY